MFCFNLVYASPIAFRRPRHPQRLTESAIFQEDMDSLEALVEEKVTNRDERRCNLPCDTSRRQELTSTNE